MYIQSILPKFIYSIARMAAATMVKTTYDYDIQSNEDTYNKLASEAISAASSLGLNGLTVVDIFPHRKSNKHIIDCHAHLLLSVQYIPTWFPGTSLLRRAKSARILIDRMLDEPYQYVKSQRVRSIIHSAVTCLPMYTQESGYEGVSMVDALIENHERSGILDEKRELLIKNAAGQIYGGMSHRWLILFQLLV